MNYENLFFFVSKTIVLAIYLALLSVPSCFMPHLFSVSGSCLNYLQFVLLFLDLCYDTQSAKDSCSSLYHRPLTLLLLLVFNQLDIRLGNLLAVDLEKPVAQVITDIALNGDLLDTRRRAGH